MVIENDMYSVLKYAPEYLLQIKAVAVAHEDHEIIPAIRQLFIDYLALEKSWKKLMGGS